MWDDNLIVTDGVHLISDCDVNELHDFAVNKLGFKRDWFQDNSPPQCPHYDLTTARAKKRAIEAGAIKLETKEFVEKLQNTPTYLAWKENREMSKRSER